MQQPSVGRVVHYVSYGTPGGEYSPECRAAIITEVPAIEAPDSDGEYRQRVGLCVLNPTGQYFNRDVPQDEERHQGGTWHWPERT